MLHGMANVFLAEIISKIQFRFRSTISRRKDEKLTKIETETKDKITSFKTRIWLILILC